MIQKKEILKTRAQFGVAIAEYGLLLGLVGILAVGGLSLLGDSHFNLFAQAGNELYKLGFGMFTPLKDTSGSAMAVTGGSSGGKYSGAGTFSNGKAYLTGGGYYTLVVDPTTGQPSLKMVNGTSGVNVNVSSVEGSRYNALGTTMLANKLDALAAAQTDPKLKDYYAQLARNAYYMGGAEGVLDNVSQLAWDNVTQGRERIDPKTGTEVTYTLGDGLRDLNTYQQQMQGLLANPPAHLNAQEFMQVLPYAVDVTNIGQNYLNNLHPFITSDGTVPNNFGDASQCHPSGGCDLGTPGPGASLTDVSNAVANPPGAHEMLGMTYDSLVSLNQLKTYSDRLMADYTVQDVPVVSTFQDAKTVDSHSSP